MGIFDSVLNNISSAASGAKDAIDNKAERTAINIAFLGMAPEWLLDDIQHMNRSIGIPLPDSFEPTGMAQLAAETATFGYIVAQIIFGILACLYYLWNKFKVLSLALIIIAVGLRFFYTKNMSLLNDFLLSTSIISLCILCFVIIWVFLLYYVFGLKRSTIKNGVLYTAPLVNVYANFLSSDMRNKINNIKSDKGLGKMNVALLEVGWTALFFCIISSVLYFTRSEWEPFIDKIRESFMSKQDTKNTTGDAGGPSYEESDVEPFIDKSAVEESTDPAEHVTIVNIQPVSIKQIGYIGPTERGGSFEIETAIIEATRAGIRFFVLQIDYLDKTLGNGFEEKKEPTLVYRDDNGNLISTNGASITDLAQKISTYGFNADFPASTQPLILYLHFVRTPNTLTNPEEYFKFLKKVAKALAPIQPFILNKIDTTDFTRQKNERALLYSQTSIFDGKILVWTNADTTIFRNTAKLSLTAAPLEEDLDYMACMRVYLDDENDSFGITSMAHGKTAHAVIAPYARLNAMRGIWNKPNSERDDFSVKGKTRFVIAMPGQTEEINERDVYQVMKVLGVNTVPMNIFAKTNVEILSQIKLWKGEPFLKMKQPILQSSNTAVAGYTPPPNVLN